MSVSDFVKKWTNMLEEGHSDISKGDSKSVLYLKDWHFVKVSFIVTFISMYLNFMLILGGLASFMMMM